MRRLSPITVSVALLAVLSFGIAIFLMLRTGRVLGNARSEGGRDHDGDDGDVERRFADSPADGQSGRRLLSPIRVLSGIGAGRANSELIGSTGELGLDRRKVAIQKLVWAMNQRFRQDRITRQADEAAFETVKLDHKLRSAVRRVDNQEVRSGRSSLFRDGVSDDTLEQSIEQQENERHAAIERVLGHDASEAFFAAEASARKTVEEGRSNSSANDSTKPARLPSEPASDSDGGQPTAAAYETGVASGGPDAAPPADATNLLGPGD
jgi:hypothetical protein